MHIQGLCIRTHLKRCLVDANLSNLRTFQNNPQPSTSRLATSQAREFSSWRVSSVLLHLTIEKLSLSTTLLIFRHGTAVHASGLVRLQVADLIPQTLEDSWRHRHDSAYAKPSCFEFGASVRTSVGPPSWAWDTQISHWDAFDSLLQFDLYHVNEG